jgi:hypothetical protein
LKQENKNTRAATTQTVYMRQATSTTRAWMVYNTLASKTLTTLATIVRTSSCSMGPQVIMMHQQQTHIKSELGMSGKGHGHHGAADACKSQQKAHLCRPLTLLLYWLR